MHSGFGFGSAFGVLGRQDGGAWLQQKEEPMSYKVLLQGSSSPCLCQICVVQANWAIWLPCSRHSVNIYETTSKSSCLGFFAEQDFNSTRNNPLRDEIKSRSFHITKRANTGMNGQPTEQEELFARYTSDKGFS